MGSRAFLGLGIIALMFFGGIAMLFFSAVPTYEKADELVRHEKSTRAMITNVWDDVDSDSHGTTIQRYANYSFDVNGMQYSGKSRVSRNYNQSGAITIYYLPSNPSNCAIDPRGDLTNAREGVLFVIVWILIVFAIGVGFLVSIRRGVQFTSSRNY